MKRRFKPVLAMLLVIILLLSSCGKAKEPEEEKHLNVAIYWNAHVNPFNGWGGWWTMRYGIGETLLTMDKDMNLVECLADSYSIEDSGTTFPFSSRYDVQRARSFSGAPLI